MHEFLDQQQKESFSSSFVVFLLIESDGSLQLCSEHSMHLKLKNRLKQRTKYRTNDNFTETGANVHHHFAKMQKIFR